MLLNQKLTKMSIRQMRAEHDKLREQERLGMLRVDLDRDHHPSHELLATKLAEAMTPVMTEHFKTHGAAGFPARIQINTGSGIGSVSLRFKHNVFLPSPDSVKQNAAAASVARNHTMLEVLGRIHMLVSKHNPPVGDLLYVLYLELSRDAMHGALEMDFAASPDAPPDDDLDDER